MFNKKAKVPRAIAKGVVKAKPLPPLGGGKGGVRWWCWVSGDIVSLPKKLKLNVPAGALGIPLAIGQGFS
jgi:hypothetical protein